MEQVSLPIKTKIAAWWMILIGGLMIFLPLWSVFSIFLAGGPERAFRSSDFLGGLPGLIGLIFLTIVVFPIGLLFFIPSIFLLKKKKKAWWFLEIILLIDVIVFLITFILPFEEKVILRFLFSFLIPPFILLLLDRKNFWKIAS